MKLLNILKNLIPTRGYISSITQKLYYDLKADEYTHLALTSTNRGITNEKYCDHEIIVSLTTYGKRLHDVYLPIESIMQGSIKPNRIVLWLGEDLNEQTIPQLLRNQQKRGLEIRFCKDIRSYTKLIPCLKNYPNAAIITIDDDLIYSYDMVEKLVQAHRQDPTCICANRVHRILLNKEGRPKSYLNWNLCSNIIGTSPLNFLTGVGGVLYPPQSLPKETLNESVFLDICPYADDVWFYAMALKQGTSIRKIQTCDEKGEEYILNPNVQKMGLFQKNTNKQDVRNDIQLKAVFNKYNLWTNLTE